MDVQVGNGSGSNHQAYLWQYGKPGGETVFDFRMGRGREGPKKFLAQYGGILQTDGYTVYDSVGGANLVRAACWAHARRKFVEALQLNPQDVAAARIAVSINGLFAVDELARELSLEQRHQLRGEKSAPLLASLHEELKKIQYQVLPAGALGRATAYTLTLWPKLIRFLDHLELELSNNFAKNSMRGVALGRKNWSISAARMRGRRWPQSCPSSSRAKDWVWPREAIWPSCCRDCKTSKFRKSLRARQPPGSTADPKPSRMVCSDAYVRAVKRDAVKRSATP